MEPSDNPPIPALYTLYFGENAAAAYAGSTQRLLLWSRAFDEWCQHRQHLYHPMDYKINLTTWKQFAAHCQKMPWQVSPGDVRAFLTSPRQKRLSTSALNHKLYRLRAFYAWCAQKEIDPDCGPSFNPAQQVAGRSSPRHYPIQLWTRQEVADFLSLLSRDNHVLGKRDYAFFLLCLNSGVPMPYLRSLRWGQIDHDEAGAWVRWRPNSRTPLALEIWAAILRYLQASGRLEGMAPGKLVFAPLERRDPGSGECAADWGESGPPLTTNALLSNLKRYGCRIGIPRSKLRLMCLHDTALSMRLDQGESLEGMRRFMDSTISLSTLEQRLRKLPPQPDDPVPVERHAGEVPPPLRERSIARSRQNLEARYSPARAEVQAALAEGERSGPGEEGLGQEIACLRQLMRLLLDCDEDERRKTVAYARASQRLATLVSAQQALQSASTDNSEDELVADLNKFGERMGQPGHGDAMRRAAYGLLGDDPASPGLLTVEITTLRLLLKNIYRQATHKDHHPDKLFQLLDLYGVSALRLAKMLSTVRCQPASQRPVAVYLQRTVEQAVRELRIEWGLDPPPDAE